LPCRDRSNSVLRRVLPTQRDERRHSFEGFLQYFKVSLSESLTTGVVVISGARSVLFRSIHGTGRKWIQRPAPARQRQVDRFGFSVPGVVV
jgi:hypothetical protein